MATPEELKQQIDQQSALLFSYAQQLVQVNTGRAGEQPLSLERVYTPPRDGSTPTAQDIGPALLPGINYGLIAPRPIKQLVSTYNAERNKLLSLLTQYKAALESAQYNEYEAAVQERVASPDEQLDTSLLLPDMSINDVVTLFVTVATRAIDAEAAVAAHPTLLTGNSTVEQAAATANLKLDDLISEIMASPDKARIVKGITESPTLKTKVIQALGWEQ